MQFEANQEFCVIQEPPPRKAHTTPMSIHSDYHKMEFLIASKADKHLLYDICLSKKGLTAKQRRDAWLLTSGTL